MMFVLKLPQRPLSAGHDDERASCCLAAPVATVEQRMDRRIDARRHARTARAASARAYGRAFMMRSCARRSFDAATIFIALVICCVFFTARIRRRRSISDGISIYK